MCRKLKKKDVLAETNVGSPQYAAPEVWSAKTYTNKVDIFSMGCCVFELCHIAKPAFDGRNVIEITGQIAKGPPRSRIKHLYPVLQNLICPMLANSPEKRPEARKTLDQL